MTNSDGTAIKEVVNRQWNHPNVQARIKYNVEAPAALPPKDGIWNQLVISLLTSQQRSIPDGPVERFAETEPFPLRLSAYSDMTDGQVESLIGSNGLRFAKRISGFLRKNHDWLFSAEEGWEKVEPLLKELTEQRSQPPDPSQKFPERSAARSLAEYLAGIGPKQSRNLLQELGLTRYEIPLDSRVAKWLSHNLQWDIEIGGLVHHDYYEDILDRVQIACAAAGVLPCVFDAAAFVEGAPSQLKNSTTRIGYVSANGQVVIRNTGLPDTDKNQYVYQLACSRCGHVYGTNSSDIHERLCPKCQGGKPGLAVD